MAIIKQYHADTDTTYVYESTSYWDPEKGQSRSKRKVIGKLDPVTGEIIPTGGRGRKKKAADPSEQESELGREVIRLQEELAALKKEKTDLASENAALRQEKIRLENENAKLSSAVRRINSICTPLIGD
jgi:hypothetical protein